VVTAVGPGLTGLQVSDRVAYAGPQGAYVEERIISADKLVPLPNSVGDVVAASIMIKGMTAQMLLRRVFKVKKGHKIFVHAAAGGVGSLLVQWGRSLGATVIAAVSSEEKAVQAKEDGADHAIIYTQENFVDRVKEITEGAGVEVVYDAVGKDTLKDSCFITNHDIRPTCGQALCCMTWDH
jgi:NADPH2:quinone reductase